jgi:lipoprotein-releasing system permease protein
MNLQAYEWHIGWRYVRAGRYAAAQDQGEKNGFISFISAVSMLGITLGVAALIIVLSVMNGFQKEVRERMLSVVSHVELIATDGNALPDWQQTANAALKDSRVAAAAPFVATQALVGNAGVLRGAIVRGISPADEARVTELARTQSGLLQGLQSGAWQVVLGAELAHILGVRVGDKVSLVSPSGQVTPAGVVPRLKQFTLVGVFDSGQYEYDSGLALVHVDDAARLFRVTGPTGVQLRLHDVNLARAVGADLQQRLGNSVRVQDWTRTHKNWFDAVQVEKRLMATILTLIVAVAAFNLVSSLVMTVTDKRADIAILRTLGASPRSIMGVFMVQGATAGVLGTLAGCVLGLLVAFNIDTVVPAIERLLGIAFLPGNIYVISRMPSQPLASDIVPTVCIALLLALVATLYPSWRASRVNPAQALRYE